MNERVIGAQQPTVGGPLFNVMQDYDTDKVTMSPAPISDRPYHFQLGRDGHKWTIASVGANAVADVCGNPDCSVCRL